MHKIQATSNRITSALIGNISGIVQSSGATAVFVYADALAGEELPLPRELRTKVFYVSRTQSEQQEQEDRGTRFVRVPNVNMTRLGQIKMAVFLALSKGLVRRGDIIVCLTVFRNGRIVTEIEKPRSQRPHGF
jgi:hypothetical protein